MDEIISLITVRLPGEVEEDGEREKEREREGEQASRTSHQVVQHFPDVHVSCEKIATTTKQIIYVVL